MLYNFYFLKQLSSPPPKNGLHIILIVLTLLILHSSISLGQSEEFESQFVYQPKFSLFPFQLESQIKQFNATKSFERFHYSDLKSEMHIYPNPANTRTSVLVTESGEFSLLNSAGDIIRKVKIEPGIIDIDLYNLEEGVYFVKLISSEETLMQRLLIKK